MIVLREGKQAIKPGTLVRDDDSDRAYVFVRRTRGDKGKRWARPGQMMFWRNRRYGLVTTDRGRLFAGLAQSNLRAGNYGFVQVYGPMTEG